MSTYTTTITDVEGDCCTVTVHDDDHEVELEADANCMVYDHAGASVLRDALNNFLGEAQADACDTANEAKLRVAVEWDLRAKFAYKGDLDRKPVERRVEPDSVYENHGVLYVGGESYDQGGDPEGYRQFRLDRISGEVVVR